MNLHVEIQGKGYPILCLHGHPGTSRSLTVFTERLSGRWQTLAPDLRGYGKSHCRGKFEMAEHLEDLEALLERLEIEQCLLLGWSLGGILALELALRHPHRFSGLILIASAAQPRSSHPPVTRQDLVLTGVAGLLNWLKPGWQWNIDTFGRRSLFRYLLHQQTPEAYRYLATDGIPAYWQTSIPAHQALNRAIASGYNCLEDLPSLNLPCLVLAGARDRHITAAASEETAQSLKNCHWYCYPDTAHLFPWEIPDLVLNDIELWLQNHFT
jgi:proline iminopeptidase